VGVTRFNASVQTNVPVLLPQEHPVFTYMYPTEIGDETLQFYGVFPGEQIGIGSDPALLETARNTMWYSGFAEHSICSDETPRVHITSFVRVGCGARFRQAFTLEDAIGSHACSLEALACVCSMPFLSEVHSFYRLAP
jgi:hypothetical protein